MFPGFLKIRNTKYEIISKVNKRNMNEIDHDPSQNF